MKVENAARAGGGDDRLRGAVARTYPIYSGLLASILVLIILLSGGILVTTLFGTREAVDTLSESVIDEAANEVEAQLRGFFDPVVQVLEMARRWGEHGLLDIADPDRLQDQLAPILKEVRQVSSLLVADENGREVMLLRTQNDWQSRQTRPDLWKGKVRLLKWRTLERKPVSVKFEASDYDPRRRPWYTGALREPRGSMRWTAPYVLRTTKQLGITASISYERDGVVHVIGFDVLLDDLSAFTMRVAAEQTLVFLLSEEGQVVAMPPLHDEDRRELLQTPDELGLPVLSASSRHIAEELDRTGKPVRFEADGGMWWSAQRTYALAPDRRLFIAVATAESALVGDLSTLRFRIVMLTAVVLALAVWRGLVLARQYGRPIEALVRSSDRIRRGDLEQSETVRTSVREFHQLAEAQNRMRSSLKTLMKMERNMQLARRIQQNTFPKELPQPDRFEIEAWSEPADATGGDTYDVLGVARTPDSDAVALVEKDPESVIALLADATGHGVGPALSVTQVRAMLRMGVRSGVQIAEIARRMNEQLNADLDQGRFITVWLGELTPKNGTIKTLSAGQGPILHYRSEDDRFDLLKPQGPPLGVVADMAYEPAPPLTLQPGDLYAVFSDGIFEARNANKKVFGEERVQAVLREHRKAHARDILMELRRAVDRFAGEVPQEDDQTVILIKRV